MKFPIIASIFILMSVISNTFAIFPNDIIIQPVSFVVSHKVDGTGRIFYDQMLKQVDMLNDAFSGLDAKNAGRIPVDAKIRFELAGVRYIANDTLFDLCALPSTISDYRPKYMMSPSKHLNIYVCWCENALGLAWLPYDKWFSNPLSEDHFSLGEIVHWKLIAGNKNFTKLPNETSQMAAKINSGLWSLGKIAVHETGHHMGLRHPYGDTCSGPDPDNITDTPRMKGNPLTKCSYIKGRDSCPNYAGKDDISNYMVATDDNCRNHFTKGQVEFMTQTILQYKPTLVKQVPPDCVASITDEDNSPDLQPCIKGTLTKTKKGHLKEGLLKCRTDPDDPTVWGYACCPSNMNWTKDLCRQGIPNFDKKQKQGQGQGPK
jgi:hypothetical protein